MTKQTLAMIRAARRVARRAGMSTSAVAALHVQACTWGGCTPTFGVWAVTARQRRIFAGCQAGMLAAMRRAWIASGGAAQFMGAPFDGVRALAA